MTAQAWVYFFLAGSAFSLFVAFFFARQVIRLDQEMPELLKFASAIKERAEAILKRQYKTVAALLGLLLPTFAYGQRNTGAEAKPTWCCRI